MTDYDALIRLLVENDVEFIIVGGAAATAHGSARLTLDLDNNSGGTRFVGEIIGGGGYQQLPQTIKIEFAGVESLCLDLEHLIEVKRAAGRPKDLEVIAELEQILEERSKDI